MSTANGPDSQEIKRDGDKLVPRVVEGSGGLIVTKVGKSFKKRPVVRAVSLSLRRGEAGSPGFLLRHVRALLRLSVVARAGVKVLA